jgi:SAM-dependent methyltransferase
MAPGIDYYERFRDVGDEDWWELWLAYAAAPDSRDDLPPFAPAEIQQRVHGTSFAGAMRGALAIRYLTFRYLRRTAMRPVVPTMKVLDFGCGWGRVLRVLLKDFHTANLFGTDIDAEVVALARELLPEVDFQVNGPRPPLAYADESFDLVVANSVFSHLSEPNFRAWLGELTRLLKPGALLVFTSWGQGLLDMAKNVFATGEREYAWQRNILNGFASYEDLAGRFASGEFVFAPTGGGKYLPGSDFGIAMVSRAYFERDPGELVLRDFLDDPQQFSQSLFFAERKGSRR